MEVHDKWEALVNVHAWADAGLAAVSRPAQTAVRNWKPEHFI
jgi:hypothetical protein